jgi:NADPH2:quinone reductase
VRVVRVRKFGPPEVLRFEEADEPRPQAGEVLVAVELAAVIFGDVIVRSGRHPFELPYVPGFEVAGTDPEGRNVVATTVGNTGGYAEIARCAQVYPVPPGLSPEHALAVFGAGHLANAMLDVMGPADTVLITAAAGRLGSLLVQLAKARGATVVAAASGDKLDAVSGLGADVLVDYRDPGWVGEVKAATGGGADVTLDAIGGSSGSWTDPGDREVVRPLQTVFAWPEARNRAGIEEILQKADQLVPLLAGTYPLDHAAEAHAALEGRRTIGAVSLSPAAAP